MAREEVKGIGEEARRSLTSPQLSRLKHDREIDDLICLQTVPPPLKPQ